VQRIRDFSFWQASLAALHLTRGKPTTLIEEFHYPRLGPGQMWEAFQSRVEEQGIPVRLNHRALTMHHEHQVVDAVSIEHEGNTEEVSVDSVT
jgi:protoporphyrinogen oxidase